MNKLSGASTNGLTPKEIKQAVDELGMVRYFPAEPGARTGVMKLLSRMVSTAAQLEWLVRVMIDQVGEWHGPAELRGVFCTRFKPADGVESECTASIGFTAEEMEMRAIERHEQIKREEIATPIRKGLLGA